MDLQTAKKFIKQGAISGFVSAGITLLTIILAVTLNDDNVLAFWNDPLLVVDIILVVGLSIGLLNHSRLAAMLLFFYFIMAKISTLPQMRNPISIAVALVFLFFFWRGIQGTFAYHRLYIKSILTKRDTPSN